MPRGPEPSWAMKTAIWDLASKLGPKPEVILRDLGKLCREDMPLEGEFPPDPRTVKRVIEELQTLKVDILATLPRRIWRLRKDYNTIRDELEREVGVEFASETDYEWEDSPVARLLPLVRVVAREGMKGGVYGGELKGKQNDIGMTKQQREVLLASGPLNADGVEDFHLVGDTSVSRLLDNLRGLNMRHPEGTNKREGLK